MVAATVLSSALWLVAYLFLFLSLFNFLPFQFCAAHGPLDHARAHPVLDGVLGEGGDWQARILADAERARERRHRDGCVLG